MLVPLPFGLARLQAMFLQFAPGALKLTPDQVEISSWTTWCRTRPRPQALRSKGSASRRILWKRSPRNIWRFRAAGQFQRKNA